MSSPKNIALITGASSGIGAVYANRLARRGYDLVLVARDGARMQEVADNIRKQTDVAITIIAADLTQEADLAQVEARLAKGDITLLINNAGMTLKGGLLDNGPTELTGIIALNVTAPTRLASVAGKTFAAKGSGAIINISSVLAMAPEMFDGVYSGTKSYLLNLSQSMAAQLKDKGVYVQAVLPGATRTEIWKKSGQDPDSFPKGFVMEVDDLVDAALVGFDRKEAITIPPLHDEMQFTAMQQARMTMMPNLSNSQVAPRYQRSA